MPKKWSPSIESNLWKLLLSVSLINVTKKKKENQKRRQSKNNEHLKYLYISHLNCLSFGNLRWDFCETINAWFCRVLHVIYTEFDGTSAEWKRNETKQNKRRSFFVVFFWIFFSPSFTHRHIFVFVMHNDCCGKFHQLVAIRNSNKAKLKRKANRNS